MILTAQTASSFWRTHGLGSTRESTLTHADDAVIAHAALEALPNIADTEAGSPLHLLITDPDKKRALRGIACHQWNGELPPGSLRQISEGVFVSSPEMCFVQFCASNSLAHSVQYGMELCGTYALGLNDGETKYDFGPLTSLERLASYTRACEGRRGTKMARRALKHILEGAASPLETIVLMLLCMPVQHGGYNLPAPILNEEIPLNDEQRRMAGVTHFRGDLSWSDKNLIVEYNSSEFHTGRSKECRDYHRGNVLTFLNRKVIYLSWGMVVDLILFDKTCAMLAEELGHHDRSRMSSGERMDRRVTLRSQIMYPNPHWRL